MGIYQDLERIREEAFDEYENSQNVQLYINSVLDLASSASEERFNSPELANQRLTTLGQAIGELASKYSVQNLSDFLLEVSGCNIIKPDIGIEFDPNSELNPNESWAKVVMRNFKEPSNGDELVVCTGLLTGLRTGIKLSKEEYQLRSTLAIKQTDVVPGFTLGDEKMLLVDCDLASYAIASIDSTLKVNVVRAGSAGAYLAALAESDRYSDKYPWFSYSIDRLDAGLKCDDNPDRTGKVLSELGSVIDARSPSITDFENGINILNTILSNTLLDVTGYTPTADGTMRLFTARGRVSNVGGEFGESASTLVLEAKLRKDDGELEEKFYRFPLSGIRRVDTVK